MPYLAINGVNLWFEREGSGPPVLLLHAFVVGGKMWLPQVVDLVEAGYEVITVDQRGHGRSSVPPAPYTISQMAEDIHQLISNLDLHKACVVGLSMGGRVAQRLALDYPQDLGALVLVSAKSESAREIRGELAALVQDAEKNGVESAVADWYGDRYQRLEEHAPDLSHVLLAEWNGRPSAGIVGAAQALINMESMTVRLSEINVPTLAMAGGLDTPCLPYLAWFERTIPDCRGAIVPDSGHFVNIEQTQLFNDLLLAFLSEQS